MAGWLDLTLCRCTTTTIKMTRTIRTATESLDVNIDLVFGIREDWARARAESETLRCSYCLLSRHKRRGFLSGKKKTILSVSSSLVTRLVPANDGG